MCVQKNRLKGDGSHVFIHKQENWLDIRQPGKLSYQSIQTPVVGVEKNHPTGAMLLHPQHVLNHKFMWKPNYLNN